MEVEAHWRVQPVLRHWQGWTRAYRLFARKGWEGQLQLLLCRLSHNCQFVR